MSQVTVKNDWITRIAHAAVLVVLAFTSSLNCCVAALDTSSPTGEDVLKDIDRVLFILDASFSMSEKIKVAGSTQQKMARAKWLIQQTLSRTKSKRAYGLRVFGEKQSDVMEIDCRQTELLVPIGRHNQGRIIAALKLIEPAGSTPLQFALQTAIQKEELKDLGEKAAIILIGDGADTCGGDVEAYIRALTQYDMVIPRIISIHLGMAGPLGEKHHLPGREEFRTIAQLTHGKYYDIDSLDAFIYDIQY